MDRAEHDLLARLRDGDDGAFTEVVDRYHRQLVRLARLYVGGHEAAEDVAQDTWIAALRGLDRFEGRSSLRTWLFQICANRARSTAARERRVRPADANRDARFDDDWHRVPTAMGNADRWVAPRPQARPRPAAAASGVRMAALARAAIAELPDLQRRVVTLRDLDGISSAQACALLMLTPVHQRVLLHRGRAAVRRSVERQLDGSSRRADEQRAIRATRPEKLISDSPR